VIEIVPLTPELLAEIGRELGGCSFSEATQKEFLASTKSCDVQAVPGHGKTTLLVAKLVLLSRTWDSREQGICVISHTNAAREEIEQTLHGHPAASAFLRYPHFIGTVTSFVNQFLAMPYLRGLGWQVHHIDDQAFEAVAVRRLSSKPKLIGLMRVRNGAQRHQVETWAGKLELAEDFDCNSPNPTTLSVRRLKGQHGPTTDCGHELEELKAELVCSGQFRYGDMTAIALKALGQTTNLRSALRQRFPLVILDEAQDTNGPHLKILSSIFGADECAYQRLGDQNQTLYEDDGLDATDYWTAGADAIPLVTTRRFGREIAEFASRLTARAKQDIKGLADGPNHRCLIMFNEDTIGEVLPAYAGAVRSHWGEGFSPSVDVRAVASRHRPYKRGGSWPKSLVDYHPQYRAEASSTKNPDTFCRQMQLASVRFLAGKTTQELLDLLASALIVYLRHHGAKDSTGNAINGRNLWKALDELSPGGNLAIRRLFREEILYGKGAWSAEGWGSFRAALKDRMPGLTVISQTALDAFLAFNEADQTSLLDDPGGHRAISEVTHDGVPIKLGSIHSVKGRTVDAVLVMETEVWRGSRADQQKMDLGTVLPHAFGLEDRNFSLNDAELAATTNVFVAVTRPRRLLALAVRRSAVSDELLKAASEQGWAIHDLTLAAKTDESNDGTNPESTANG
jgi:DNA helicase-2/ATP-dependent DNA helicase PcrA